MTGPEEKADNERQPPRDAEGSVKMQDLVKTAASRLMI
jgi:hypothetical protein